MDRLKVLVETLLPVPTGPAREGDAGMDLMNVGETITVDVNETVKIPCGIRVKIPRGHFGMITGRSSTFAKKRLHVPTSIIDEGYVGPLFAVAYNPGVTDVGPGREVKVERGERIAQLLLIPYRKIDVEIVDELPETERGSHGFGSTG